MKVYSKLVHWFLGTSGHTGGRAGFPAPIVSASVLRTTNRELAVLVRMGMVFVWLIGAEGVGWGIGRNINLTLQPAIKYNYK